MLYVLHFHKNLRHGFRRVGVILTAGLLNFAVVTEDRMFKVSESHQDDSYVIKWAPEQTVLYQVVNTKTRKLVHCFCIWVESLKVFSSVPNHIDGFFIVDSVENAITAQNYEVMLFFNSKGFDFWYGYKYLRIPTELRYFCLDISKRSAHRESTRENPCWSRHGLC